MRGVVLLFAVIAAFLVTSAAGLVATEEPASAAFPGQNGRMVFSSNMRVGEGVDNPEGDYEIFTVDPDGTDLNQLTRNATHDSGTAWSADGKRIAYSAYDGNDYEIYTIPAGGGEPTQITDNTEDDSSPAFSPDGTKIAYNGLAPINEENPDWKVRSIYTIPSSGGTPTAVIRSNADSSYYGPYDPDWAPDGTKIAYWSNIEGGEGYSRLKVLNLATGHSTGVTQNSPVFSEWAPEWSPDGSQIAFVGYNRDPEGQDIYTVAAAGGTPVALTDSPDDWEGGAVWSPDGSKIAYRPARGTVAATAAPLSTP
jgi:Tol biopolymer transport system component